MNILHVITGLSLGGAEQMLCRLLLQLDAAEFKSAVVSLLPEGPLAPMLAGRGIPVHTLGMRRGIPSFRAWFRLRALIREYSPDLVQGWMYHGNLAATAAAGLKSPHPVLWNIRQSLGDLRDERAMTRWAIYAGARLSGRPGRIIYNSRVSATHHTQLGYADTRQVIIGNGFDTMQFAPAPAMRDTLRTELRIPSGRFLIGHFARFHPMKDHANLLRAFATLAAGQPDPVLVLGGPGVDAGNQELIGHIGRLGIAGRVHLVGVRSDLHRVLPGLDTLALSSGSREGFPNIVGEAMACAIPCVVTDAGDCADVIANTGFLVPPRDSAALAAALRRMFSLSQVERNALGSAARERILDHYSIAAIAAQYAALYRAVGAETAPSRHRHAKP